MGKMVVRTKEVNPKKPGELAIYFGGNRRGIGRIGVLPKATCPIIKLAETPEPKVVLQRRREVAGPPAGGTSAAGRDDRHRSRREIPSGSPSDDDARFAERSMIRNLRLIRQIRESLQSLTTAEVPLRRWTWSSPNPSQGLLCQGLANLR